MPDKDGNYSRDELKELVSREQPDLKKIGDMSNIIKMMFSNWNPMPDVAYAKLVGWPVHEDGTITTGNGWRVPSRELCEEHDIQKMLELEDTRDIGELEQMFKLDEDDTRI